MATSIPFDLNAAFHNWREKLEQLPHFRAENLDELEAHLRDSVTVLQSKGLTADEAFLIGLRRVGAMEGVGRPVCGRERRTRMARRIAPLLSQLQKQVCAFADLGLFRLRILAPVGCLRVSQMFEPLVTRAHLLARVSYPAVPAFTLFFWALMPYWYLPPLFGAVYCGYVWTRKSVVKSSWFAFFAFATAFLFLLLIPTLIAAELPIISLLQILPPGTFQAP